MQNNVKLYNGKVYAIRSYETDKIYIGSTTLKYLSTRLVGHKQAYKQYQKGKHNNVTSFEIIKYPDAYIELISLHENVTKDELRKFEGEAIRQNDNSINKCLAGRSIADSKKNWMDNNPEKIKEINKSWRDNNPDKKREANRKWREKNKDYHKQYYLTHKKEKKE